MSGRADRPASGPGRGPRSPHRRATDGLRARGEGLLPLVERDPGWDCVEASSGRVIGWDPEGLSERSSEATFNQSFREIAPSVEAWLAEWASARTVEERMAERVAATNIQAARDARARIAAKTPEERAQMGVPEVGRERVVWGGLGLEDDTPG